MAVTKIQDDWQIQPTTATENAETQANMAAALAEQQKTQEQPKEDAPASIYDDIANIWSADLTGKAKAIERAAEQMTARDKERKEAEALLTKARENRSNFLGTLLEEQKPVRKEDEEKKLRNRAIIKGLGDLVGAVASGAHAFGKRGAGVVPTLATSSPLKDIEKLNALQEEYLKRKEAWKALDLKIRMGEIDTNTEEAQAAYNKALERMKDAKVAYKDALDDYATADTDYRKDMTKAITEERRQDRIDERERYTQSNMNYRATIEKQKDKDAREKQRDKLLTDAYNALFPWEAREVKTENYDMGGRLLGHNIRKSTYSQDKDERAAEARINEYTNAIADLVMDNGYSFEEAVSEVRAWYEEENTPKVSGIAKADAEIKSKANISTLR